jgi:hypothetical protein
MRAKSGHGATRSISGNWTPTLSGRARDAATGMDSSPDIIDLDPEMARIIAQGIGVMG